MGLTAAELERLTSEGFCELGSGGARRGVQPGASGGAVSNAAVIAGYSQTPYHKRPAQPTLWYAGEAVRLALANCGIPSQEVDGLGVNSFMLPPDNTATLAEHLGLCLRWAYLGGFGGAGQVVALLRAVRAIELGEAETVVLVAADAYSVAGHAAMLEQFNSAMRDYLIPYGMGGANGLFAMLERRHRYEYGTSREQLGKIAVTQRANTGLNPNALLRTPLTLDDYLGARLICDPIRGFYDCVLPCARRGSGRRHHGSQGAGSQQADGADSRQRGPTTGPRLCSCSNPAGRNSLRDVRPGGNRHADLDMLQLYDDYPIMEVLS